jgi:hypothetical protein
MRDTHRDTLGLVLFIVGLVCWLLGGAIVDAIFTH